MKRLMRAAPLLLVMLACASSAFAFPRLSDPIAVPIRNFNATFVAGVDSAYSTWNSSGAQPALVTDSSAWFALPRLSVPNFPVFADSIPLLQMLYLPVVGTPAAAADSFNFVLQGSLDGVNVAMSAPAVDILELGTGNGFSRLWNSTRLGAFNGVTATNVNMYGFPFYRILIKDFTGTLGMFQLYIRYWQENP